MGSSLAGIGSDLGRAQGILSDAVVRLLGSFENLRTELKAQKQAFDDVGTTLCGPAGNASFATVMGSVLQEFVDAIVATSAHASELLQRMDAVDEQVTTITGLAGQIEKISGQTKHISFNARIEAHRSGAAGGVFRVVADEVKALAAESQVLGSRIGEVVANLQSAFEGTHSVVSSMATHDMKSAVDAQERLGSVLRTLEAMNQAVGQTLIHVSDDVATAIQALQFEDMLLQLLASVQRRVAELESLCNQAWEDGETHLSIDDSATHPSAPQAVSQVSMDVGTVELF